MVPSILIKWIMDLKPKKRKSFIPIMLLAVVLSFFLLITQTSYSFENTKTTPNVLGVSSYVFGTEINQFRSLTPRKIYITEKGKTSEYLIYAMRAGDIVKEAGLEFDSNDEILPNRVAIIPHMGKVTLIKVDSQVVQKDEEISFETKRVPDDRMEKGKEKVKEKGVVGVSRNTYLIVYRDDKRFSKELIEKKILSYPKTEIISYGTQPVIIHNCTYWNNVIDDVVDKKKDPKKNTWMKYVMLCETGCNSGKGMEKYFEGSKAFYGLYQFTQRTYNAYGGKNLFDGHEQIEVVSRMYDLKGNPAHHWPTCNTKFERDYNK